MIERLLDGNKRFREAEVAKHRELYAQLAEGQSPKVLLITCADSRIDPFRITDSRPGELFVVRNAGNIVPGEAPGGESASIEFAVDGLKVEHAIIMGHTGCGAVKGRLDPKSAAGLPTVQKWVEHIVDPAEAENWPQAASALDSAVHANVLLQLSRLKRLPSVAKAVAAGRLQLHGWVYELAGGRVVELKSGAAVG